MSVLVREEPNSDPQQYPWDEETKTRFKLEPWEVTMLDNEEVVWRGDVAYTLEPAE